MWFVNEKAADLMNTIVVSNKYFFINLWSVVHFILGGFWMFLIIKLFKKRFTNSQRIIFLFALLILYEVFEGLMVAGGSTVFRKEVTADVAWDVIWGMIAGWISLRLFTK